MNEARMRMRRLWLVLAVPLLTGVAAAALGLGKTTIDPNSPEAGKVFAKDIAPAGDARLGEEITYVTGQTRLWKVAEHLTKVTGVSIRSGTNSKDWQIRDIPLVVCAKDLPLGKLLKLRFRVKTSRA